MELGQAFYNRLLISIFIVVSSLRNDTYVYMFDEQTAKKGTDEVISLLTIHFTKFVGPAVQELDIQCNGCAGQSWNNRLALFCEEILDPESGISNKI
jgi:hypothetical protein